MRIAVIGATGVVGRHVVPRLREHGHEVRAVVRAETDAGPCAVSESMRFKAI